MIRKLEIAKIGNQYQVTALYRAPMEDMFERISHPALFRNEDRANRFMAKINAAKSHDLSKWILPTAITSYIRNEVNPAIFSVI